MPMSTIRTPRFFQLHRIDDAALADEAAAGLLLPRAQVAPKFFYDALGSRLFDAITALDEYYPTRTEAAIFEAHGGAIAAAALGVLGPAPLMIDLGAADCAKAARLFPRLRPGRYVAVDISVEFLRQAMGCLQREHPQMDLTGVGLDFSARLQLGEEITGAGAALVFYPGSSIGNFAPDDALRLLREARALARGGAVLIGVDLVKDARTLHAAYDDDLGVTAAFNLNLLKHLNRLLGADFDVRHWRHVALFDEAASRIEMHLEARHALVVRWRGGQRRFAAGERIHTENSYKWTPQGFGELLRQAGFGQARHWTDERGWFAVFMASG